MLFTWAPSVAHVNSIYRTSQPEKYMSDIMLESMLELLSVHEVCSQLAQRYMN